MATLSESCGWQIHGEWLVVISLVDVGGYGGLGGYKPWLVVMNG